MPRTIREPRGTAGNGHWNALGLSYDTRPRAGGQAGSGSDTGRWIRARRGALPAAGRGARAGWKRQDVRDPPSRGAHSGPKSFSRGGRGSAPEIPAEHGRGMGGRKGGGLAASAARRPSGQGMPGGPVSRAGPWCRQGMFLRRNLPSSAGFRGVRWNARRRAACEPAPAPMNRARARAFAANASQLMCACASCPGAVFRRRPNGATTARSNTSRSSSPREKSRRTLSPGRRDA